MHSTPEAMLDNHQPASNPEPELDASSMPGKNDCEASTVNVTDLHQPDFSRLERARATLDAAFPDR